MISGDSEDITEKLDKGLIDFGLFVGKVNLDKYNCVSLPDSDRWGVIVRLSDKLSIKSFITKRSADEKFEYDTTSETRNMNLKVKVLPTKDKF